MSNYRRQESMPLNHNTIIDNYRMRCRIGRRGMVQGKALTAVCALGLVIYTGAAGAAGRGHAAGSHPGGHGVSGHYGGLRHGGWHGGVLRRGGGWRWSGYNRYYYGGDYVVVPGVDDWTIPPTPQLPPPPPPLVPPTLELTCHHSQQIVAVPSEGGGIRQITIIRC
jgi:hypothetical protein